MSAPSPSETAGIMGGLVTMAGGAWIFVKWLFQRSDQRARKLDQKEAELVKKLEDRLDALEAEQCRIKLEVDHWRVAFKMVADRLHALNPKDSVLAAAGDMLRQRVAPDDPFIPADMREILKRMDSLPSDGDDQ